MGMLNEVKYDCCLGAAETYNDSADCTSTQPKATASRFYLHLSFLVDLIEFFTAKCGKVAPGDAEERC